MESRNIYQRLNACMAEISYIKKEDKKVNKQYSFVSHDEVSSKLHPLFQKHGIVRYPSLVSHTVNGNRLEAVYEVRYVNIDNPTDFMVMQVPAFGIDPQDKGPGKSLSYATKMADLKVMCLESGEKDVEEDLIDHVTFTSKEKQQYDNFLAAGNAMQFYLHRRVVGDEKWTALFDSFPQGQKMKMKESARVLESEGNAAYQESLGHIKTLIDSEDRDAVHEVLQDLSTDLSLKMVIWQDLNDEQKAFCKEVMQ